MHVSYNIDVYMAVLSKKSLLRQSPGREGVFDY